jgi:hypothetical protein
VDVPALGLLDAATGSLAIGTVAAGRAIRRFLPTLAATATGEN